MARDQTTLVSGGGIIGSIRTALLADPSIVQTFGTRIIPGRLSSGWQSANSSATQPISYPFVILSDVAGSFSHDVYVDDQRVDITDSIVQVSIYTNSYDTAISLGDYVHGVIRQVRFFNVAGRGVFIQPLSVHEILEPKRSETGSDIWQSVRRFRYWRQIGIKPISDQRTVNGSGFISLPGFLSSGAGESS